MLFELATANILTPPYEKLQVMMHEPWGNGAVRSV